MYEDDAETSSYEDEEIVIATAHDKELRYERKPCSITVMYLMQETIIFISVEEFRTTTVHSIVENICVIMEANQIIVR